MRKMGEGNCKLEMEKKMWGLEDNICREGVRIRREKKSSNRSISLPVYYSL